MAWVESHSASFTARHSDRSTQSVAAVLGRLEELRAELAPMLGAGPPSPVTLIMHDRAASLAAASPLIALAWRRSDPASRPLISGWAGEQDIHLLSPAALSARAAGNPALAGVLARAPASLLARQMIVAVNRDLRRSLAPARTLVSMRWAWLLEGGSRYLSGEAAAARPLVAARLRSGRAPSFPPGPADAPLLAATVLDLLAREHGRAAVPALVTRLHPDGARGALISAFGGRSIFHTEGAWRSHLARLAG